MGLIRRLGTRFRTRSERGQGLAEYALVIALVSIVTIGAVTELGQALYGVYYDIVCALGGESSQTCDCGAAERITVGPTVDCSGGMFSAQALTTCGDGTSLSLLFDYGSGSVLDIGLSYDSGSGLFVTSFADSAGLCAALAGANPPGMFLISRKPGGGMRVFNITGDAGGPSDAGDGGGGNPGDGGGGNPGDGGGNPGDGGGGNPGDGGGGNPGDGGGGGGNPLPNQPPTVETITDQNVNEGDTLTITVTASDPDGDPLTFSGIGLQSFMTLDSATGALTVTPGATDSGTYPITITVGDGKGGLASVSFDIRVINVNAAPVLDPIGAQTVSEGDILSLTITASDGDFDPITLTATGLASFMTFIDSGGGSATFTATPGYTHSGTYSVTVTAADTHGAASSETFTVTVVDTNPRVTQGLIGLWWFTGFSGQNFDNRTISDTSGFGAPLTLRITHLGAGGDSTKATSDGGLNINKPIKIESTANATKIVDAIKASNAFTVELWLRSSDSSNSGPGRILTMSKDISNQRNLTIGQGNCNGSSGSRYCLRLRTTNASGYSQTDSGTPTTSTSLQHFVMTYSSSDSRVRVYINGSLVYNQQISGATGALSGWNNTYPLLLANEFGVTNDTRSERDWTGDLYLLAFYNRVLSAAEISQNYAAGHLPPQ